MDNGDVKNQDAKARRCSNCMFPGGYKSNSASSSTSETQRTLWLIPIIVVYNVIMFIMIMFSNNCPENNQLCVAKFLGRFAFQPLRENPLFGPSSLTIENMGGLKWDKEGVHGSRILDCIWLHAGLIHLLVNMISLLFIGIRLEKQFGFGPVIAIYWISGVFGSTLSALFIGPHNISVGASGPLFGLLGATLSEMLINWTTYTNKAAALLTIIIIIMINLAVGIFPHVDNFANIGGFFAGFLFGFHFLFRPQFHGEAHLISEFAVCSILVIALIIYTYIFGFVVLFLVVQNEVSLNDRCNWCHYLYCIPTSRWNCSN